MVSAKYILDNKTVNSVSGEVKGTFPISTDSRTITEKDIFVALDGPNFKGVKFCQDCLERGVRVLVLVDEESSKKEEERLRNLGHKFSVVYVTETLSWLQECARLHLAHWQKEGGVVVALTGSNGKTTHKEMLAHLLGETFPGQLHYTHKNFNNHIGVPMSALAVSPAHKIVVLEMGTNHPGEIADLCRIAEPSCGFITNIGDSHLEFFCDRAGVFQEKKALYESIKKNGGVFLVNGDDPFLKDLPGLSYGVSGKDFKFERQNEGFALHFSGERVEIKNANIVGAFNHFNMGLRLAFCLHIFPEKRKELTAAAGTFVPPSNNRASQFERDGKRFFLDAYNANPSSMKVAIRCFVEEVAGGEPSLMILGDMNELGERAGELHEEIGRFLKELVVGEVVFVGNYGEHYARGFGKGAVCYKTFEELAKDWPEGFLRYKVFFIKGSRSLQLERLLDITKR